MKKLKISLNNGLRIVLLGLAAYSHASEGGPYQLAPSLWGVPGNPVVQNEEISVGFAWGEPVSGFDVSGPTLQGRSGYYSTRFGVMGTLRPVQWQIRPTGFIVEDIPVGISPHAVIEIQFNDPLDEATLTRGVSVTAVRDAVGTSIQRLVSFQWAHDARSSTLVIARTEGWSGNTLFDVVLSTALRTAYGAPRETPRHIRFLTMLDPHQENRVLYPVNADPGALGQGGYRPSVHIRIPADALNDYAVVMINTTPQFSDPSVLEQATARTASQSGYHVPVFLREVVAYDRTGRRVETLSKMSEVTVAIPAREGWVQGLGVPVRASTLRFWMLDGSQRRWIALPDSRVDPAQQTVNAPLSRFSVFAVMGSAEGDASTVTVYPAPWRPSGPHAGDGPGQTGTEAGGITFNQVPSECRIRIYTLSGQLVRELRHSDLTGPVAQEKWDGKTEGGAKAASGVYLWRVESASDAKNGKLMIIR